MAEDDIGRALESFNEGLNSLFDLRVSELSQFRNLRGVARVAMQAELARAEDAYGPNDPRTLNLKSRLEVNKNVLRAIEVETDLVAAKPVSPPGEGELLIEGRVADSKGRGAPSLVGALTDANRQRIRAVEPATTDRSGYFALRLAEPVLAKLREAYKEGVYLAVYTQKNVLANWREKPITLDAKEVPFIEVTLEPEITRPPRTGPGSGKPSTEPPSKKTEAAERGEKPPSTRKSKSK